MLLHCTSEICTLERKRSIVEKHYKGFSLFACQLIAPNEGLLVDGITIYKPNKLTLTEKRRGNSALKIGFIAELRNNQHSFC